ncbi:stage II sporulation protein P [Paeniclostridium hominis]|uniref:stage II sporulation protein P n=1 Tax=Paeniclostridium hominis TaxID=2764329 RepID=UPI0022E8E7B6|nr:stage II sporulation protein P [Paeniclostridium hominis]
MVSKKLISLSLITCIVCIVCLKKSYALENDEFLKFLMNASYPETKLEQPKDEKEVKDDSNNENKSEKKDDEFVKMYVGEENLPTVESSNKASSESAKYVDNVLVTKNEPQILIYHTHGGETYANNSAGNYHSEDKANSTLEVGATLTQELNKRGRAVVHNTTYHDIPQFVGAYGRSLKTIETMQAKYSSIDMIIDLHRDGRTLKTKEDEKKFKDACTTNINGENVAKFLFVVGKKSPNYSKNLKLAEEITAFAESKYPGITRPVVTKGTGNARYNQHKSDNPLLIEVGGQMNTTEEAKASTKYIAEIIDEFLKQKGM